MALTGREERVDVLDNAVARGAALLRRLGRVLPLIAVILVLGPILIASVRFAGGGDVLVAVVTTIRVSFALVWLSSVLLRDHRELMVEPDEGLDHVLRRADAVMYRAKRGPGAIPLLTGDPC